jgi:hypothetical protein
MMIRGHSGLFARSAMSSHMVRNRIGVNNVLDCVAPVVGIGGFKDICGA